jgi:hypothetical protein
VLLCGCPFRTAARDRIWIENDATVAVVLTVECIKQWGK